MDVWQGYDVGHEYKRDNRDKAQLLALCAIADGLFSISRAIQRLGTADAATPMGAIEAHGALLKEELVPALCSALLDAADIAAHPSVPRRG